MTMPILETEQSGDRIFLRGVEVLACHGVLSEERTRPQRFVVDADVWLDAEGCARSDDYKRAVCYGALQETIIDVARGPHRFLIEALALSMVDELLRRFWQIERVRITVHKPEAPLGAKFTDVGVSLTRQRARRR